MTPITLRICTEFRAGAYIPIGFRFERGGQPVSAEAAAENGFVVETNEAPAIVFALEQIASVRRKVDQELTAAPRRN